jgi:TonB family protein
MNALTRTILNASLAASALAAAHPAGATTIALTPLAGGPTTVGVTERCAAADRGAAIDGTPFFEMPEIAREQRATGESVVRIDLAATGALRSAALFGSSGNRWLDAAALSTARMSRYVPEVRNCLKIAGAYLVSVHFGPDDLS